MLRRSFVLALVLGLMAPFLWAKAPENPETRVVFIAGQLPPDGVPILAAAIAATEPNAVLLLDSPGTTANAKNFLAAYRPDRVIPVGFVADAERRLGTRLEPAVAWKTGWPTELWKALFPKAERVVVCPPRPRGLLLQAACLAGTLRAPLVVTRGEAGEADDLCRQFRTWGTREVYLAGMAAEAVRDVPAIRRIPLPDAEAVATAHLRQQLAKGPVPTLVVANPADVEKDLGAMSALAPWAALTHQAPLLLTNDKGDNVASVVRAALQDPGVRQADNLILVASLRAIPTERRPNPAAGNDAEIEMEPLTPVDAEPFTFATGRLFHQDPATVALMLARRRLVTARQDPLKALVVSNPGGSLPLLETFSRNTAQEFRNAGYQATARFDREVNGADIRRLLPGADVFLWEGHHQTLVKTYGMTEWTEPLPSSFIFLQSCLALNEAEVQPLLRRGAVAVAGSATRTYSGSGGAFTLAFFDTMLYDHQSLGGALRHAKNFLLTYSLLKEKRLGADARLTGANLRSAWAFSLWGDPTLKLPDPKTPADSWTPVRHRAQGNQIVIALPDNAYDPVLKGRFQAQMRPNARLAGLLRKDEMEADNRHLVPFVFAEVYFPDAPANRTPRLRGRIPERNWIFRWDARRRCGYLLVTPRPKDERELRFRVEWEEAVSSKK